jgi:transcription antitermination factor NusG
MFASTACPGPWMKAHANDLCNKVNAQLNSSSSTTQPTTPSQPTTSFKVGDLVKINAGARYYGGGAIPQWVVNEKWYISSISGDRAVLGLNEAKNRNIQSPINTKDITLVKTQTTTFKEYTKSFKGTDKIYGTAGGAVVGTIGTSGIYTIVDEKTVGTVTYGKLKSGKGWVIVRQQDVQIKKGDKVRVKSGKNYIYGTNNKFTMFVSVYTVLEVNGDRVVISSDGKNVTTAINKNNLEKA